MTAKHPKGQPYNRNLSRRFDTDDAGLYYATRQVLRPADDLAISESVELEPASGTIYLPRDFDPVVALVDSLVEMRDIGEPVTFQWILSHALGLSYKKSKRLDRDDHAWLCKIREVAVEAGVYARTVQTKHNGRRDTKFRPGPMAMSQALQSQEFIAALQRPSPAKTPAPLVNAVKVTEVSAQTGPELNPSEQILEDLGIIN